MEKNIVLGAKPYDFSGNNGNVQMTKVYYIGMKEFDGSATGYLPMQITAPLELYKHLDGKLPAVCEMSFRQKPDAKGKPITILTGCEVVRDILFEEVS